jgi:hypothetical protein
MDFSPLGGRSLTERHEKKHGEVGGQAECRFASNSMPQGYGWG